MSPFIEEFEKENPDISIDFSYAPPTAEYIQTLQTRLVGNQAPGCVHHYFRKQE